MLKIVQGFAVFEFDLGGGTVALKSDSKVTRGKWHHLKAKRYHQDGLLELDGQRFSGSAKGSLRTLNISPLLWIGGVKNNHRNFVGCMKDLSIGRKVVPIHAKHETLLKAHEIVECQDNPCSALPCSHEGYCKGQGQGFTCECSSKFTGRRCQKARDQCHPNPCLNRGKCQLNYSGFHCECKDGFYGRVCEKKTKGIINSTRFKKRQGFFKILSYHCF